MSFFFEQFIKTYILGVQIFIDGMMSSLFDLVFRCDDMLAVTSGVGMFSLIMPLFYGVGVSLIVLKFLKKAFDIYVLWSDGDPDTDPASLLINFIKAIVTASVFPFIYGYFIDIADSLTTTAMNYINGGTTISAEALVTGACTLGITTLLFVLIFFIAYFVLYFQLMMRGLEMCVMQVGVPLACVGLLDNDKGVFKAYLNQFVKAICTTMIQIVLCKVGLALMLDAGVVTIGNIFWGIAALIAAITIPTVLKEFLIPTGGGGGGQVANTIYQTAHVFSMAKSALLK